MKTKEQITKKIAEVVERINKACEEFAEGGKTESYNTKREKLNAEYDTLMWVIGNLSH